MKPSDVRSERGFALMWCDLDRWSVSSLLRANWKWSANLIKPLSTAIERRVEPVDKHAFNLQPEHFISIRFSGEIEPRDLHGKSVFKGQLFFAYPGDIVYSKIDVRHGAIGIIPDAIQHAVVTSEFPVYRIKSDVALQEYIQIVFRTAHFRSIINGMVSGTSGRKRVQPEDLEKVRIPLPDRKKQERIVDFWQSAQRELAGARSLLLAIGEKLNARLWSYYHQMSTIDVLAQKAFSLAWYDMSQWDGKSARAIAYRLACPNFVPMSTYAEEANDLVHPRDEPEKDWPVFGVNNSEGVFFSHYQKGKDFNAPYKRIKRDWFFHNPTRANVGSLGVVPVVPDDAITSPEYQVWRVKNETPIGYIATLITTEFFLRLVNINRVGAVKQRLYTENLLRIVVPPVHLKLMKEISEARSLALRSLDIARQNIEQARGRLEDIILGSKSIESI